MSKKSFGISSAPPPAACCLAPTLFAAPFGKVQPALSAPFDKVQLSPQPFPSAPFDKVQHPPPFPSALFGKVQHPPPWFSAPFGKVQMPLPPMFFSAPFGKVQTPLLAEAAAAPFGKVQLPPLLLLAAAPLATTGFFCCCFWASLAFCLSSSVVAKAKSLSLSAQAFWYLSFLAWLTVPLPGLPSLVVPPCCHCNPFAKGELPTKRQAPFCQGCAATTLVLSLKKAAGKHKVPTHAMPSENSWCYTLMLPILGVVSYTLMLPIWWCCVTPLC